ncbi:unnamed protein product [Vitrella brassicaformis CCMP3155]|uniref:MMS19 nucleotide excision repair protein n=2 Tax=Vitrella brassicaformis TaxID=1169539 RepID=A0A0G4F193_VITBC|nr:unnamed protein product [Vitrella brassicaformis CCMP3155]|eukprot:CEM05659.1 unnamed protein product [Vitrella brassicaformis CCMP3155]
MAPRVVWWLLPVLLVLSSERQLCNGDASIARGHSTGPFPASVLLLDSLFIALLANETTRPQSLLLLGVLNTTVNSLAALPGGGALTDTEMASELLLPALNALARPLHENGTKERVDDSAAAQVSGLLAISDGPRQQRNDGNDCSAVALTVFAAINDTYERLLRGKALSNGTDDQLQVETERAVLDMLERIVTAVAEAGAGSDDLVAISIRLLSATFGDAFGNRPAKTPSIDAQGTQDFLAVLHVIFKASLSPILQHAAGKVAVEALLAGWRDFLVSPTVSEAHEAVLFLFSPLMDASAGARLDISRATGLAAFLLPSALNDVIAAMEETQDTSDGDPTAIGAFIGHIFALLQPSCSSADEGTSGASMATTALFDSLEALLGGPSTYHLSFPLESALNGAVNCTNCTYDPYASLAIDLLDTYMTPSSTQKRKLGSPSIDATQAAQLLEGIVLANSTSKVAISTLDGLVDALGPVLLSQNETADTALLLINSTLTTILESADPHTDFFAMASLLFIGFQSLASILHDPDAYENLTRRTDLLLSETAFRSLFDADEVDYGASTDSLQSSLLDPVEEFFQDLEFYGLKLTRGGICRLFFSFGLGLGVLGFFLHRILPALANNKLLPRRVADHIALHYPFYGMRSSASADQGVRRGALLQRVSVWLLQLLHLGAESDLNEGKLRICGSLRHKNKEPMDQHTAPYHLSVVIVRVMD